MTRLLAAILTPMILAATVAAQAVSSSVPAPAYRPFIDPINVHDRWWLTLIPLALGISLAYKAVRVKSFDGYFKQVLGLTFTILLCMVLLAAGLYVFIMLIVPALS